MRDKILGVVLFALCGASQVLIRHADTAMFFGFLFGALGAYEFIVGELRQRAAEGPRPPRDAVLPDRDPAEEGIRSGRSHVVS